MGHRNAFLLAALIALVGLAWMALGTRGEVAESMPFSLHAVVAGEEPADLRGALPRAPIMRRPIDGKSPSAMEANTIQIRVIERETRRSVEGATVWFFTRQPREVLASRRNRASFIQSPRKEDRFARFGASRITDGDGCVTVPLTRWGARCVAYKDEMYGELSQSSANAHATFVVELDRDITARVRVVDQGGEPVSGVGVQLLRSVAAFGFTGRKPDGEFYLTHGQSRSPDGIVVLEHLQVEQRRWPVDDDGRNRTRIQLEILGHRDSGVPLDSETGTRTSDPIVMRMPPTGRVVVEVRDPHGRMTSDGYLVGLDLTESGSGSTRPPHCPEMHRPLKEGHAVFEHVAVGQNLRALVRHDEAEFECTFAGPTRDGETVKAELRLDVEDFVLTGRALYSDGRPVADAAITASVRGLADTHSTSARGVTDGKGRFRVPLATDVSGRDLGPVRFRVVADRRPLIAQGPNLGVLRTGVTPIGDVRFRRAPPLVAGRVVAADGRPIPLARGFVETRIMSGTLGNRWQPHSHLRFHAGPDGRFAIEGDAPGTDWRLQVEAQRYAPREPVPFTIGQDELTVVLAPGGEVRMKVLVDEGTAVDSLSFRWQGEGAAVVRADGKEGEIAMELAGSLGRSPARLRDGWAFHWRGIAPGRYRIESRAPVDQHPAARLEQVVVRPNETTHCELDLRGKLHTHTITVSGESGQPVAGGYILVRRGRAGDETSVPLANGTARITTARAAIDVLVSVPGHRPRELSGVHADLDVRLTASR